MIAESPRSSSESLARVRVLIVLTKLSRNGAVLSLLGTLRQLERPRFEPTLFLAERPGEPEFWQAHLNEIQVAYGQHRAWPSRSPLWLGKLIGAARRTDIVIGAQETSSTYLAVLAATIAGRPVVGIIRNSLPDHLSRISKRHTRLTRILYPRLTGALAVSVGVRRSSERLIPALQGRVRTVHPPIEVDQIRKASNEPLAFPYPYVAAVGRLYDQKGFDLLIRAYALLKAQGFDRKLVIIGDGAHRPNLEELVDRLGLEEHIVMPGFTENPYPWIRGADLFVSSSRYEGFGRVIAEALAVGTPVVATDCPSGPSEILAGGRYGVLVRNESPDALAKGIRALLSDPDRLRALRESGPQRAETFAAESAGRAFERAITEALVNGKGEG